MSGYERLKGDVVIGGGFGKFNVSRVLWGFGRGLGDFDFWFLRWVRFGLLVLVFGHGYLGKCGFYLRLFADVF